MAIPEVPVAKANSWGRLLKGGCLVIVVAFAGGAKLMKLTGTNLAPVLQVGEAMVSQGMNEERWQAMLDQAGYPRTPPPRRMAPGKGTETPPDAKTAANTTVPPTSTSASTSGQKPAAAPVASDDGGYPK